MKVHGVPSEIYREVLTGLFVAGILLSLGGCKSSSQLTASDDTFFEPLKSAQLTTPPKLPQPDKGKTPSAWDQKADSLLMSQQDQDRRLKALDAQLQLLGASGRGPTVDSSQARKVGQAGVSRDSVRSPQSVAPRYEDALRHFEAGRYRNAVEASQDILRRGVQKDVVDQYYFLIGASYYHLKQFDGAVTSLKRIINLERSTKKADAYLLLGQSYKQIGMREQARIMFEGVIKESPESDVARAARRELENLAAKK